MYLLKKSLFQKNPLYQKLSTAMSVVNTETENGIKKIKLDQQLETEITAKASLENVLTDFELVKVLNETATNKVIFIHAVKKLPESKQAAESHAAQEHQNGNGETKSATTSANRNAVLIFEKPHFSLEEVKSFLNNKNNSLDIDFDNDIYKKMSLYPVKPFNSLCFFLSTHF